MNSRCLKLYFRRRYQYYRGLFCDGTNRYGVPAPLFEVKENNFVECILSLNKVVSAGVGAATDFRQLLDSILHHSLVVAYSRVCHIRVGRTLEYATLG